jgi:uncharacterized membrane protein
MHHYFFPFGFIFFLLLISLIIANIRMWRHGNRSYCHGSHHAQSIAKRRLANGEINEEEYHKLMDILKN